MSNLIPRVAGRSVKISGDQLHVSLDAKKIVAVVAKAIAEAHQERIPEGMKADGSGSNKAPEGGPDGILGYETGVMAASIRAKVTGGKANASATVGPRGLDEGRAKRFSTIGHRLMYAGDDGTPLGDEINRAVLAELEKQIK